MSAITSVLLSRVGTDYRLRVRHNRASMATSRIIYLLILSVPQLLIEELWRAHRRIFTRSKDFSRTLTTTVLGMLLGGLFN